MAAISRHKYSKKLSLKDDNQKTITEIRESFPRISIKDISSKTDIIVKLKGNDTLDGLAIKYLGDGRYWWVICLMNNIMNPLGNDLFIGRALRIPTSIDTVLHAIERNRNAK